MCLEVARRRHSVTKSLEESTVLCRKSLGESIVVWRKRYKKTVLCGKIDRKNYVNKSLEESSGRRKIGESTVVRRNLLKYPDDKDPKG